MVILPIFGYGLLYCILFSKICIVTSAIFILKIEIFESKSPAYFSIRTKKTTLPNLYKYFVSICETKLFCYPNKTLF